MSRAHSGKPKEVMQSINGFFSSIHKLIVADQSPEGLLEFRTSVPSVIQSVRVLFFREDFQAAIFRRSSTMVSLAVMRA
jgi:hypothetical protein